MTKATVCLEFEIEIEGTVEPYVPARMPSFSDDVGAPAEGGYAEDVTISDLGLVRWIPTSIPASVNDPRLKPVVERFATHSLLSGVDTSNPEVQKLLGNLLSLIEDDAAEALFAAHDASRP